MDLAELDALIRSHQAELFRYARYLGVERGLAADLVQETFLEAVSDGVPEEVTDHRATADWLREVLRDLLLDQCERWHPNIDTETVARAEEVWKNEFLRSDDGFEYIESLQRCLRELPDRSRQAVSMQYRDGRSREELGRILNLTEDGVRTMMRDIRASLDESVRARLSAKEA